MNTDNEDQKLDTEAYLSSTLPEFCIFYLIPSINQTFRKPPSYSMGMTIQLGKCIDYLVT